MKKLLYAILLVASATVFVARAQAQVLVIANPGVNVSEVSKNDLIDVFTGSSTSIKGTRVMPVLLAESLSHERFLREYIGKSDVPFRSAWRSLVLSGQAVMPRSLPNDAAVVQFVANNAGAIGYIGESTPHADVKVLVVK